MELENIVENEEWIIDYFGYFPKWKNAKECYPLVVER